MDLTDHMSPAPGAPRVPPRGRGPHCPRGSIRRDPDGAPRAATPASPRIADHRRTRTDSLS